MLQKKGARRGEAGRRETGMSRRRAEGFPAREPGTHRGAPAYAVTEFFEEGLG